LLPLRYTPAAGKSCKVFIPLAVTERLKAWQQPMELPFLCFFAFLAGLVDSVVGGGGLIQLPALFIFLPPSLSDSLPAVFGTNKLSSICGTGLAVIQYSRRVPINWASILPAGIAAFVFSFLGARVLTQINPQVLKPLMIVLLIAV